MEIDELRREWREIDRRSRALNITFACLVGVQAFAGTGLILSICNRAIDHLLAALLLGIVICSILAILSAACPAASLRLWAALKIRRGWTWR